MAALIEPKLIVIQCPHCKFSWNMSYGEGAKVLYCPEDEGGCGKNFVVEVFYKPIIKIFTIEEVEG